jgi:hypothetical protein
MPYVIASKARQQANHIKCLANLHNSSNGFMLCASPFTFKGTIDQVTIGLR